MKIWLDDTRAAPDGWTLAQSVDEAIALLRTDGVTEISLDYDLDATDGDRKGAEVLDYLEAAQARGVRMPVVHLHTVNPWGAASMAWKLNRMESRHGQQPFPPPRAANPVADRYNRVPGGLPDGDVDLARELLERGALLIDVRSPKEYASGHLRGAINVPHDRIAASIPRIDALTDGNRAWAIIVYCVWGIRGAEAKIALLDAGFPNVLNVGGLDGLLGRPLVQPKTSSAA